MVPKLKLICPTDDVADARLVDALSGAPVEADATVEVHYQTHRLVDEHGNHRPWLVPPVCERTAGGTVAAVLKEGVPAPIVTRCAVTLHGEAGTYAALAELEVAPGVLPFCWHHCRLTRPEVKG